MLYGEKTRLCAVEEGDIATIQRWVNELDRVVLTRMFPRLRSKREVERWLESGQPETQQLIVETSDGRQIGILQIKEIDVVHRHGELALIIGEPDYRWRGFEEDAIRVATGYMFEVLNLHRVSVSLTGENERVRKLYEACGFKVEGRREDYYWAGDRYIDQVVLRLLAHEYRKLQGV